MTIVTIFEACQLTLIGEIFLKKATAILTHKMDTNAALFRKPKRRQLFQIIWRNEMITLETELLQKQRKPKDLF